MSEIDVRVGVDVNSKPLKNFKKDLRGLGPAADFAKLKLAAVSYAIYRLGKESVIAAAKAEKLDATFATTLRNMNIGGQTNDLLAYIDKVALATGVLDSDLIPAFSRLLSTTKSVSATQSLLNTAVDTAAGTGKDLSTVVTILTKALEGQRKGLGTLGLGIDAATLKTMDLADVIAALNSAYGGTAAANASTYAGMLDRLRIAGEMAKETLGKSFLDQLDLSNEEMADLTTTVQMLAKGFGTIAGAVGSFVATTISGLKNIKDYFMSDPLFRWIMERLGMRTGPRATGASTIGDYNLGRTKTPEQKANEALLKVLRAIEAANKKRAAADLARQRAADAAKKRQAQLDKDLAKTQMMYDTDRIGLMKALSETQSADTKKRLNDLLLLNTATYAQALGLSTTEQMLELINAQMEKWFGKQQQIKNATIETANAYADMLSKMNAQAAAAGLGRDTFYSATGSTNEATMAAIANITEAQAANVLTSMFPELDRGAANPGAYGGTQVNVTVNGSLLAQQDLEAAIAGAVNTAARAGLSYSQVFSRL